MSIKAYFMVCIFSFNLTFCRIGAASGSMKMTKVRGKLDRPCLAPLCSWKLWEVGWLVIAQAFVKPYSVLIQSMKNEPNRL